MLRLSDTNRAAFDFFMIIKVAFADCYELLRLALKDCRAVLGYMVRDLPRPWKDRYILPLPWHGPSVVWDEGAPEELAVGPASGSGIKVHLSAEFTTL